MEPGSAVISGPPIILCAVCCQGRSRRKRERHGEGGTDLFQLADGGTFQMSRDEKEEKQESKGKTAPDRNGEHRDRNTATPLHSYTCTFLSLAVNIVQSSPWLEKLYKTNSLCALPSQSPGGVLVPRCQ